MTDEQWKKLVAVIDGEVIQPLPVGFIIDSPWLPGWAGMSVMDYFSSEQMWFAIKANCTTIFCCAYTMLPNFVTYTILDAGVLLNLNIVKHLKNCLFWTSLFKLLAYKVKASCFAQYMESFRLTS